MNKGREGGEPLLKPKKGQKVLALGTIVSPRGEFSSDHAVVRFSSDDDEGSAGCAQCAEVAHTDLRAAGQPRERVARRIETAIANRDDNQTVYDAILAALTGEPSGGK